MYIEQVTYAVAGAMMMCNNDFTNIMNVYVTIAIMIVKGHTRAHSHRHTHVGWVVLKIIVVIV